MATEAQLIQGLQAADAAGNTADAQHFADQIKSIRSQEPSSPSLGLSDIASGAAQNFIPSAEALVKNTVTPFLHPIDTAKSLYHLGAGIVEKAIPGTQADEATANAVGKYFVDRYGGMENIKHTMATDPAGFMADAAGLLTGGGALATKLPGMAGKAAEVVSAAGRVANPMALATKTIPAAVGMAGGKVADVIGGLGTHTGGQALRSAAQAGFEGGDAADAFLSHLRGQAPIDEVVADARNAVGQLRRQRGADYRAGMGSVSADPTVLDFAPVDAALAKSSGIKSFKGVDISEGTADVRQKIANRVEQWKKLDPAEYHTAEGFDALKQSIGDIRDNTAFGTPARVVADQAYHAVRDEIVKQAPSYGKTMAGYEQASATIRDIEKTLSLTPNANIDTSLRKLQSVLRDNVNTSYGRRADLAQMLVDAGATHLMSKLAGQALKSVTPRGLGSLQAGTAAALGAYAHNPLILSSLPFQSPRLMGEGAYYAGKAAKVAGKIVPKSKATMDAALAAELIGAQQNNQNQTPLLLLPQIAR